MQETKGWALFLRALEDAERGRYIAALAKSAEALGDAALTSVDRVYVHNARSEMYQRIGCAEEATAEGALAYHLSTGDDKPRTYGAYLFSRHYHELDSEMLAGACRDYGRLFRAVRPFAHVQETHSARERIRIGYISPDFKAHIVARFMHPFFAAYDRTRFAVYGYALCEQNPVLESFAAQADAFCILTGCTAKDAARRIYEDGIDILVDLSGHTAGSALPILARKPAPIQVSGIGWFNTTGLSAVDYVLGDVHIDPVGEERYFSEEIIRLPHSHLCYRPVKSCDIAALPALRNGYITFGSLNAFSKVTDDTLRMWADILERIQTARLFLKGDIFDSEDGREIVTLRLQSMGIDASRVTMEGRTEDYLTAYNGMDIALDTFPYPGGGTTCDALYMGVPVVTLSGDRHGSRFGKSLLENVGLSDLVAENRADYVETAAALAADIDRLRELRMSLRTAMEASHVMDARRYMQDVEAAYTDIFHRWMAGARGGV